MNYQYKVIRENDARILEAELNSLGADGWKLVSVVQDYENAILIATLMKEAK